MTLPLNFSEKCDVSLCNAKRQLHAFSRVSKFISPKKRCILMK